MGSRMELFEQIRRDRDREGLSIRALAARHGVHRRAVRQALASPLPSAKRAPVSRPAPKLGAYRAIVDAWLEADREAPRRQRHTAKRIWRRLVDEHGADVAETTVRDYVRQRKRAIGWPVNDRQDVVPADGRRKPADGAIDARTLVGLRERRATTAAARAGCTLRVIERDGERLVGTRDLRRHRVNVRVRDGRVVKLDGVY
jgi:hypothetical protein